MRETLKILHYSTEELKLLGKTHRIENSVRFLAIYYISQGMSSRSVAERLVLLGRAQITRWVHRFNELGLAGLVDKPKKGRTSRLSDAQVETLKSMILNVSPEEYGFNSGTWTAPLLSDWVKKHWNVCLQPDSFYPILHKRAGLTFQKGKGFYPEAKHRMEMEEVLKKNSIH